MKLSWWHWVLGGGAVYALLKATSSDDSSDSGIDIVGSLMATGKWIVNEGEEVAFSNLLPGAMQQYSDPLIEAARTYGLSPWLLAGVMWRESNAGQALTPPNAGGTGDWTPRPSTSTYFKYANPTTGMPPDGLGWGRGLMQLDYGAENAWVINNAWWDPVVNITKAASKLADLIAYFSRAPGAPVQVDSWRLTGYSAANVGGWGEKYGLTSLGPFPDPRPLYGSQLYEAALSAYNAGTGGVLQAVSAGLPASAATAGNSYGTWILAHIATWSGEAYA